ncbi:hypothetical protein D9C73_023212 [Collichthys lucidus]|uniref:Uncharacterized protein n=1 Tax=Collichthys lucidus TaxID=240159 RepID=A0A4U5VJB4_COLLU|nr:hypothetical protein D9C73_023212 [Collichthys lucidus]
MSSSGCSSSSSDIATPSFSPRGSSVASELDAAPLHGDADTRCDLFFLVGGGGDGAIRIHHSLGTTHHRHQQEETQEEEEEESEAQIHVHLKRPCRIASLVHVAR